MKLKKIMIVAFILLAILTIGAASASQNITSDDLAVSDDENIVDATLNDELKDMDEDVNIEVNYIDTTDSSANFTTISVKEKTGSFVIRTVDDDNPTELYRDDLSSSDKYYEDEGNYCFGVSLDDVNNYISGDIGDVISSGDSIRFIFEYQGDNLVTKTYSANFVGDFILLTEKSITEDNFNDLWVASHETKDNGQNHVCRVCPSDVDDGTLFLTITDSNGDSRTFDKEIDYEIVWQLDELYDIIDNPGVYTFNLNYNGNLDLGNYTFTLTQVNFDVIEGELYYKYPFDILRIYNNDADVEVFVNDNPYQIQKENPIGWSLEDLDITLAGDYNISLISYDEQGEVVDNYTFTLNIIDEIYDIQLWTPFNVKSRDMKGNVLCLASPDEYIGQEIIIYINNDEYDRITIDDLMNWNFDELKIDHNGGYEISIFNASDDEYITETWLSVECIINEDDFGWNIPTHVSKSDDEREICYIWWNNNIGEGTITLSIKNPEGVIEQYNYTIENSDADKSWQLADLGIIDDYGIYTINLTYTKDDELEVFLAKDHTLTLTHLDYSIVEGDVHIDYPFDIIRFYNNNDEDEEEESSLTIEVYVNDNTDECQSGGENPLRWTLNDLGITAPGEYRVTINASDDEGDIDEFVFNINVYNETDEFRLVSNNLGYQSWDNDNLIVYLVSPEGSGGTYRFILDDNELFDFEITSSVMIWTFDELGINRGGWYEIAIYDDDEKVAETGFDVDDIKFIVDISENTYNDVNDVVVYVHVPNDKYGTITVSVGGNEFTAEARANDDYEWTLKDLKITDEGLYEIEVLFDGESLANGTLNVIEFKNDTFRAVFDKDLEILKVFCFENGIIHISVEREPEGGEPETVYDDDYTITSEDVGKWISWSLDQFGFNHDGAYYSFMISIKYNEDDEEDAYSYQASHSVNPIDTEIKDGVIYSDLESAIISIRIPDGRSGKLYVIVDGVTKYSTKAYSYSDYDWNLKTLNMTAPGDYDVTVRFVSRGGLTETLFSDTISVTEFANNTFRLKMFYEDDEIYASFFATEADSGKNLTCSVYRDKDGDVTLDGLYSFIINSTNYNKWIRFDLGLVYNDLSDGYYCEFTLDGDEISAEYPFYYGGLSFDVNVVRGEIEFDSDILAQISIPYERNLENVTLNITSGDTIYFIRITDIGEYEWTEACYKFLISFDDVHSFDSLSDKDVITFIFIHNDGKMTRYVCIQKEDGEVLLYSLTSYGGAFGTINSYGLGINIEVDTYEEDDEEEEEEDGEIDEEEEESVKYFAVISIPDALNVTDGEISVESGNNIIFSKDLSHFNRTYQYYIAGYQYCISYDELNLTNICDKDLINVTLTSKGKVLAYQTVIYRIDDEKVTFYDYYGSVHFNVYYGELANPEHGMGIYDGIFIDIVIPDVTGVDEGIINITLDDGTVLFTKSLSAFDNSDVRFKKQYSEYYQGYIYDVMANETIYSLFPQNVNLTFTFTYDDAQIIRKGIRIGDVLYRIVVTDDVADMFNITIADEILVNGEDFAVNITAIDANRQSIYISLGGGYFSIYVNGVRVEDLGRINRYDGETELDLFRLCSSSDGVEELYINLRDLNITENGIYNIKITHTPDEDSALVHESEIYSTNITLTSNVKSNYQNESVEWLTGYGINPVLMYLDTYYGDIDEVNGTITVLNDRNETILTSSIKDLPISNNRRYLSYSQFRDDFTKTITVKYTNGNERNGQTTMDVLWRNVTSEDFIPVVNTNVEDYYGNFVNLNIPDLITTGQIIVTVKFKNKHNSSISNMNVTTDFDSKAVYKFTIEDIKTTYPDGNFKISMNDLGFFEANGDYDVDVKFSGDGVSILDVVNQTVGVELLNDIIITINETSRYGMVLPFASIKIFEPMTAYGELYIDGKLYSHQYFEKGLITFTSSQAWTAGTHTAEVKVFDSEFGNLLNSSSKTFETLIQKGGVTVTVGDNFKENENATIVINVPENGTVYIQIDGGNTINYTVTSGNNTIDLGVLSYGNHTIWIIYENENATAYYNNYITIFIGDDGRWVDFPDKIVLNDEDLIKINLGEGAEGYVLIYIDDKLVANRTLINGACEISLTEYLTGDNIYGMHNYTIIYYDNDGNMIFSKNGTFTVTYIFKDNIDVNGVPLQEYYVIIINLPADATGYVTITVNNYTDTQPVINGQAVFIIEGLPMGEYDVLVEYSGDDKYPPSSYHTLLNVSYYGVVGDFMNGKRIVSLLLPENATGNLVIYNDNRGHKLLYSVELENGKAKIDLANVPVDIYDILAVYDGDDYEVKSFTALFRQMPKVNITQNVVMGDDVNIYLDLDNATGDIVISMDGLSPVVREIKDGKVNYTLSTEGYSYGNHTVNFLYFGNSFDGNIFYEEDGKTKINYMLSILSKETNPEGQSDGNTFVVYVLDNETGEIAYDATGTITFFINGVKYDVVDVVNGIASLDISQFKNGDYLISWVYSGDNKYGSSSNSKIINVNNQAAKIIAGNAKVMYLASNKYAVTVYKADGSPAGGMKVTFLINNKVYKTATTNSKGVASVVITHAPGSYKITSKAPGVSVTKTLTVKHVLSLNKVKVKKFAKKLVLKATLKKVNGKYLKGKKITFKFNGKKFKAKTNKKGVAKITIKQNILKKLKVGKKVKYQATYLKDTVKMSVKVKK